MSKENEETLSVVKDFFHEINADEFKGYLSDLTADAMLGTSDNCRLKNSNRVTMLTLTVDFINQLNTMLNKEKNQ